MALTKVIGAGVEGLTLSSTDLKIDSGDLVFSTADKGVVLGATSNTDANTITDYEEGTWTPQLARATTNPTISYNHQVGLYIKIGSLVNLYFNIYINTVSSQGAGTNLITALPFASTNTSNYRSAGSFTFSNIFANSSVEGLRPIMSVNASQIFFRGQIKDQTNIDQTTSLNLQNNAQIQGMISYQTDA